MFDTLKCEVNDGIAHIVLDRPNDANAFNPQLARDLYRAALKCDHDPDVRVVLLSAEGKIFSAGGDLKAIVAFGDDVGPGVKELADDLHRAISTFARMRAPLVVAVQGTAAGAGFSLAIAGDYVLASETAKFTMAYTAAGLSPDGSSSYFLPRLVGLRRAQDLMLTNRVLTSQEALDWGVVSRVVEHDGLLKEAQALCAKLAAGSKAAHADVKKLLQVTFANGLEEQMELEGRAIARNAAGAGREGVTAFIEKRPPNFN